MIPALLPALGREGGAQHSRFWEPAGKGEWAEPLGWEKGEKEQGGPPFTPWPGCLQSCRALCKCAVSTGRAPAAPAGAGLGLPLKSLP